MNFSIEKNILSVQEKISSAALRSGRKPEEISLVAVSKGHTAEAIIQAHNAGIKIFGESYAQEFRDKMDKMKMLSEVNSIRWHFIGHLQTNKVKYVAPFAGMIHSVDSTRLAEEISKHAVKNNREIEILLQVNTSGEESKSGCAPEEIFSLAELMTHLPGVRLAGLMTIPREYDNPDDARPEFQLLRNLRDNLRNHLGKKFSLSHLSMGMSHDFEAAIEEGATLVRIGTAIFGERNY